MANADSDAAGDVIITGSGVCRLLFDFTHAAADSDCALRVVTFETGKDYPFTSYRAAVRFSPGWVSGFAVTLPDGQVC